MFHIVGILATVVLVGTVCTLIFAISAYIVARRRTDRYRILEATAPIPLESEEEVVLKERPTPASARKSQPQVPDLQEVQGAHRHEFTEAPPPRRVQTEEEPAPQLFRSTTRSKPAGTPPPRPPEPGHSRNPSPKNPFQLDDDETDQDQPTQDQGEVYRWK